MTPISQMTSPFAGDECPSDMMNPMSGTFFSLREREVIQALSNDQNVKMIASNLHISAFTVQDHIKNIKHKMDVHTPGGIVAQALRKGLIE